MVKFIYRTLFKAAFLRYIHEYPTTLESKRFSSTFSYAYFTPLWLPKSIHFTTTDNYFDLPTAILPNIQPLRKCNSTDNISLVIGAFNLKEPSFAASAIGFVITSYFSFPADSPLFHTLKKPILKKRSDTVHNSSLTSGRSSKLHVGDRVQNVRRRSTAHSDITSYEPRGASTSSGQNLSSSPHRPPVTLIPLLKTFPTEPPPMPAVVQKYFFIVNLNHHIASTGSATGKFFSPLQQSSRQLFSTFSLYSS